MQIEAGKKNIKKESKVLEGTMKDLATTVAGNRKKGPDSNRPMFKGEVEAELNKAGQPINDNTVKQLAQELMAQGVKADGTKYESLAEATEETTQHLVDGSIVMVSAKKLIKGFDAVAEQAAVEKATVHEEVRCFLEKQGDKDVMVRVCSKGHKGYVVRLLEPGYGASNIFVEYADAKPAELKETGKEVSDMELKKMLGELVKENDKLKKQIGESVLAEGHEDCVPKVRYEAAKKLIDGCIERLKKAEQARVHESKRVKAATKLIHKLVNDHKAPAAAPVVAEVKAVKTEDVAPVVAATVPPVQTPVAVVAPVVAPVAATPAVEAVPAEVKAPVTESKAIEAPAITQESQDLMHRIHGARKAVKPEVKESAQPNLMSATVKHICG